MEVTREYILSILKNSSCFISSHEHLGKETLVFSNGFESTYKQDIGELFFNLQRYDWGRVDYIASVVTTMPCYYFSKSCEAKSEGDPGYGIYGTHNKKLLCSCYEWIQANPQQIPLPFISIDVDANMKELKNSIKNSVFPIMGFKLHPPARKVSIERVANSDFIRLASEINMPILLHCARADTPGDFREICDTFLNKAIEYDLTVCIAHAGFLNSSIKDYKGTRKIFFDISPWSIIMDSVYGDVDFDYCVEKLVDFIGLFPDNILYGGDSPFDLQVWDNGEKHGRGRFFDFMVINEAVNRMDPDLSKRIFCTNPLHFLSCG